MSFCHLNFCLYLVWLRSFLCAILVNGFIQRFAATSSGVSQHQAITNINLFSENSENFLNIPELAITCNRC